MRYEYNLATGEISEYLDTPSDNPQGFTVEQIKSMRQNAHRNESDPIFFKEQRGEVPVGTWLALVNEIKLRYPEPVLTPVEEFTENAEQ